MQILCTLDGSAESEAVLPVVARLAKETHSSVILFTVVSHADLKLDGNEPEASFVTASGPGAIFRSSTSEMLRAVNEAEREQLLDRATGEGRTYLYTKAQALQNAGIEVEIDAVQGRPSDEIISAAGRYAADLIAMGTHGRTGLNALVHGSVAGAVVQSGVAPVILVRPDTK